MAALLFGSVIFIGLDFPWATGAGKAEDHAVHISRWRAGPIHSDRQHHGWALILATRQTITHMKSSLAFIATLALGSLASLAKSVVQRQGSHRLDGNMELWSVQDGASPARHPPIRESRQVHAEAQHFLIWRGGVVKDFELTLKYRIVAEIRASSIAARNCRRVRADRSSAAIRRLRSGKTYSGILYEERARGILAKRGEKT